MENSSALQERDILSNRNPQGIAPSHCQLQVQPKWTSPFDGRGLGSARGLCLQSRAIFKLASSSTSDALSLQQAHAAP